MPVLFKQNNIKSHKSIENTLTEWFEMELKIIFIKRTNHHILKNL